MTRPAAADATLAPVWTHRVVTTDLDRLARGQSGWQLRYEQLSPGPYLGELELVQLPGLRLVAERHNRALRQRGQIGADVFGFALAAEGAPAPDQVDEGGTIDTADDVHFAGQRVSRNAVLMGRGDDIDICTPPGFAFIAIVVDRALLEPLWAQLYGKALPRWLDGQVAAPAAAVPADAVRARHRATLDTLAAQPQLLHDVAVVARLRDTLLQDWLSAIPERVDPGDVATLAARRRLVDRACAAVLARPDQPPALAELCRQVGVSPRKLGYCFDAVLGTSPARYLRAARLNAARAALRRSDAAAQGVQDVAAQLGFWHFGQFAKDYRQQFGELPSATLKAARAGASPEPQPPA